MSTLFGAVAVFAGVYAFWDQHLPGRSLRTRVYLLGGIAVFSAVLIPFLKYPANPPGVGDPGTLTQRQLLYIGCLLLSVVGVWIAARMFTRLKARTTSIIAAAGSEAVLAVWLLALFLLLPDRTDPVNTPETLLRYGGMITSRNDTSGNSGRMRPESGNRPRRRNDSSTRLRNRAAAAGLSRRIYARTARNRSRPSGVKRTLTPCHPRACDRLRQEPHRDHGPRPQRSPAHHAEEDGVSRARVRLAHTRPHSTSPPPPVRVV